jgi:hypothetical protein
MSALIPQAGYSGSSPIGVACALPKRMVRNWRVSAAPGTTSSTR